MLRPGLRTALSAAAVLLVTACAGPRPAAPGDAAVQPPAAWRTTTPPVAPSGTRIDVDADWWRSFGDPALSALVAQALSDNLDIQTAATRIAQAEALSSLARAQRFPNVSAGVTRLRERDINPAYGVPELQTATESMLSPSYNDDLSGRLAASSRAASARVLATKAAAANVRLTIAASTAHHFISLRAADARLQILRETLAARTESLRIIRRRVSVGYASALDLSQAEADYRATEQLIPQAELAIRRLEDQLGVLLGENPGRIERSGPAIDGVSVPTVPPALPSSLLRRRPDIVQGEEQLVAADRSLDAARAAFMPDLELSINVGSVTSTLLRSNPIGIFSAGGSVLAPIFDFGRLQAQAGAASAARDEAAYAYRKSAITAFAEVEDALSATQRTDEQLASLEAQRGAAARALKLATDRYRAGYAAYLEQLDAQRGLLSTELAIVQARSDRLTASVALYQALGGGWDANSIRGDKAATVSTETRRASAEVQADAGAIARQPGGTTVELWRTDQAK